MDPVTASMIISGGFQVWSSLQQASLIEQRGQIQRNIAELNAQYIEHDAQEAERHGYTQAARYQSVVDKTIGQQRAIQASQGIDMTFGTAAQVREESKLNGFLNTLDIHRQARSRALGLKFKASNMRLGAEMQGVQTSLDASATKRAGIIGGASTAASGYMRSQSPTSNAPQTPQGSTTIVGNPGSAGPAGGGTSGINRVSAGF